MAFLKVHTLTLFLIKVIDSQENLNLIRNKQINMQRVVNPSLVLN
jgi:hypothetical protein